MSFAYVESLDLSAYTNNGVGGAIPVVDSDKNTIAGLDSNPMGLIKIASSPLAVIDTLVLSLPNWINVCTPCIDTVNNISYWATGGSPRKVLKVTNSDLSYTTLNNPIDIAFTASCVDEENGYAYFGYGNSAIHKIEKLRLSDFSWQGTLDFTSGGISYIGKMVITGGYLYAIRFQTPVILKIRLSDFSHVDTFTVAAGYYTLDTDGTYLYSFVYKDSIYKFIRISLSDFSTYEEATGISNPPYAYASSSVIDVENRFIYFGTNYGYAVQIDLDSFEQKSAIHNETMQGQFFAASIDTTNLLLYFYEYGYYEPGYVHKFTIESRSLPISSIYHKWHEPIVIV